MSKRSKKQEVVPGLNTWQVYKRLFSYTMRYKSVFVIGIVFGLLYAAFEASTVKYIEFVMEVIIEQKEKHYFTVPLALIGIAFFRGIANFVNSYCMAYVGNHITNALRTELADKYLRLPLSFFHNSAAGELVSRLTYNTNIVVRAATAAPTIIVREVGTIVFVLAFLLYTNWQLTLMFFLSAPIIAVVLGVASKRFKKISSRIQTSMGDVTQITNEIIVAQQVVKLYGGQAFENGRFSTASNHNRLQSTKLAATKAVNTSLVQIIIALFSALLIGMAIHPDIFGSMEPAEFIGFLTGIGLIVKPIRQITNINPEIQAGVIAAYSIFEILDLEDELDSGTEKIHPASGGIEFNNVSFSYAGTDRPVIKNLNLLIEAGKTVALVGKSGSGKTTLSSLIPRFYQPSEGEIKLDGVNIGDIELASLREQMAMVSQKVVMFNCSIYDNIAYGVSKEVPEEKVYEAAKLAYADEFISKLPEGYNTFVGDDGVQLSGGQRQRIAIARAMLKNSPILILDEATSALDNESELYIQKALETVMKDRTSLVIAHRLSTIESADLIVVMDEGQVAESGTHQELLDQNGLYAQLHRRGGL